jgi:hypothetical protein
MTKAFQKLKTVCGRVIATSPNGSEHKAVKSIKRAVLEWSLSGEDVETGLFSDDISGEIELCHLGDPKKAGKWDANELYQINDGTDGFVVMTGAELQSIVKQLRSFQK